MSPAYRFIGGFWEVHARSVHARGQPPYRSRTRASEAERHPLAPIFGTARNTVRYVPKPAAQS